MKTVRKGMAIGAVLVLSAAGVTLATDQPLTGFKGIIRKNVDPTLNKAAFKSLDTVTVGVGGVLDAGDPTAAGMGGGGTSSVKFDAKGANDVTINLSPPSNWTAVRNNTGYRYRDATCIAKVRVGKGARAKCLGPLVTTILPGIGPGISPLKVTLTLNTQKYCATFGFGSTIVRDGSNGKKFLARNSPYPGGPPCSPSGAFLDSSALF